MNKNSILVLAVLFGIIVVPLVSAATVNIDEFPVFVRPKDGSGNLIPTTSFSYVFKFTTDSSCANVLLTRNANIVTDKYGVGFANLDISALVGGTIPSYLCEYRDGPLRATHKLNKNVFGEDIGSGGSVDWTNITNIPSDISDGDDDTTYVAGTGITLGGTTFSLDLTYADNRYINHNDYPNLDTDSTDDITGVTAGAGLTGGGSSGSVTVDAGAGEGIIVNADNITVDTSKVPFIGDNEIISGSWTFNNDVTINGDFNVIGTVANFTVNQQITNGSVLPGLNNTFNIGSASLYWNTVYANTLLGTVDWTQLTNIPADISDGDDDTTYTNLSEFINDVGFLTTDNDTLAGLGCSANQYALYNGSLWGCANQPTDGVDGINGTDGVDGINGTDGVDGINGTDGVDGVNGTSVTLTNITGNGDGTYTWFFSDGFNFTTQNLTGPQGIQGIQGVNGVNGTDGIDGVNGTDGESVNITAIDLGGGVFQWNFFYVPSGNNFLNFTTSNLTGPQGIQGIPGINGTDGTDGVDGTNGTDGVDGINGTTFDVGGIYLYNNGSNVIYFNDSALPPDQDTTYTNISEFTNDVGYLTNYTENDPVWMSEKTNYYNKTEQSTWDMNESDDFNGSYNALDFSGTTGLQDGVDNDTTYNNLSEFNNDIGFITNYTETDPLFIATNNSLARTGTCPNGTFVVNTTTSGVQCASPDAMADTQGINTTSGAYLYDDGVTAYFNDTLLNQTISALDTDTTYTNGTGILLLGTTFSLDNGYFTGWDTNVSDDFDGVWSSLTSVPAGFSDGVDNDTQYTNLSEFVNDVGYLTSYTETDPYFTAWGYDWNNLTNVPAGFSDGIDNDTTYTNSTGILLTGTTFSLDSTYFTGWDMSAADDFDGAWSSLTGVPAGFSDGVDNDTMYSAGTGLTLTGTTFNVNTTYLDDNYVGQNEYPDLDVNASDDFSGNLSDLNIDSDLNITGHSIVGVVNQTVQECVEGIFGGYVCFNSTHTWIG